MAAVCRHPLQSCPAAAWPTLPTEDESASRAVWDALFPHRIAAITSQLDGKASTFCPFKPCGHEHVTLARAQAVELIVEAAMLQAHCWAPSVGCFWRCLAAPPALQPGACSSSLGPSGLCFVRCHRCPSLDRHDSGRQAAPDACALLSSTQHARKLKSPGPVCCWCLQTCTPAWHPEQTDKRVYLTPSQMRRRCQTS